MKAIVAKTYGAPSVLTIQEVPEPTLKDNHILIQNKAASVNSGDARIRGMQVEGLMKVMMKLVMGWSKPRQPVLGTVYAGEIIDVGTGVTEFKKGDKVYGTTGFKSGCYQEKILVSKDSPIALMPENTTFEEAAALPFGGQTALHFLRKVNPQPHQKAMVYGASGAVGVMALQILKNMGLHVTAITKKEKHNLMHELQADVVMDYRDETFKNHQETYDIIFDCVGFLPKSDANKWLGNKGQYLTVASTDVAKELKSDLETLSAMVSNGQLKPIIDRTYNFNEIVQAHEYLDTKQKQGSIILKINP